MADSLSRRRLISSGAAIALVSGVGASVLAQSTATQPTTRPQRPPQLPAELVREFVGAAHSKPELVRQMLAEQPSLANATWDWGGGDFETGVGAAAHMGRPDIAAILLDEGARMDIPLATMLGQIAIVRAACEAFPGTHRIPGAHGIPLVEHARKGGEAAKPVLAYLESLA